jgi:hypothetical protein
MLLWTMNLVTNELILCHSPKEHRKWHSLHRKDHKEFIGSTFVYTLFLGIGPLPFIVKINGPRRKDEWRFATWDEAIKMHAFQASQTISNLRKVGSRGRVVSSK